MHAVLVKEKCADYAGYVEVPEKTNGGKDRWICDKASISDVNGRRVRYKHSL